MYPVDVKTIADCFIVLLFVFNRIFHYMGAVWIISCLSGNVANVIHAGHVQCGERDLIVIRQVIGIGGRNR